MHHPRLLIFDSGLGGLTVYDKVHERLPEAQFIYLADNAAFPYGNWQDQPLVRRIIEVLEKAITSYQPDLVIIACNTASTLALDQLRQEFEVPFVGVVPAVKMASEQSKTGCFTVLATPGTVRRQYTKDLIDTYAKDKNVHLVGAPTLALLAEQKMRGEPVDLEELKSIIWPCLNTNKNGQTDIIVLACTHFPLLMDEMLKIVPWPVEFIDPAPSIAERTLYLLDRLASNKQQKTDYSETGNRMLFTSKLGEETALRAYLKQKKFMHLEEDFLPLPAS